jgi:2-polyprenyl-3-methyl-5-hydroxy-6-metoxy-1,4-benzoquinol methylase
MQADWKRIVGLNNWPDLTTRSEAAELMDDRSIKGHELVQALHQLRWINWLLGAAWPTLEGVAKLWRRAGKPSRLSILDIGAGSGDINWMLLRWASWQRIDMRIILVDIHPDTCAAAAAYYEDDPRVYVVQGDLFQLPPQCVDIVTASLFAHHFPTDQLPAVFKAMLDASRIGIVVNDLHRHIIAWASIWLATRLLSRNRMLRTDAPLSVRRGFRAADFAQLRAAPGLAGLRYSWRPLFRYLIVVLKDQSS